MPRAGERSPMASSSTRPRRCAVPQDPPLKDPKDFTLIGKPLKRLDTPDKVNGSAIYGIDAMLPGMKFATLAACPVFGGKVGQVDDSAAKAVPGVRQVIVLDDLVAVVGDHMWAAKQGLDALKITWDEGANAKISSADIWDRSRTASKKDGVVAKTVGDIAKGLAQGERDRCRIRAAVPRPRDHGADELHGSCDAGFLRGLGRHASADARAGNTRPKPRACRSIRSWCTIICSAAASAGGWSPTWSRAPCASPSMSMAR